MTPRQLRKVKVFTAPEKPQCSGEGVCTLTVLGLLMAAGCPNSVIIFQVT